MSNHEQTIRDFLSSHPTWERTQLRKKLNDIFNEQEELDISKLGFVPDGFEIHVESQTVRLLEVDGHSYTKPEKMTLISDFWYEMDTRSWTVELHTVHLFTGAVSVMTDSDLSHQWNTRAVCYE